MTGVAQRTAGVPREARTPQLAAVRRTLARTRPVVPDATARAEAALGSLLPSLAVSTWPEIAFSFSSLTNTGTPIEFSWASRDLAVRWTSEVAPPEVNDAERLGIAMDLAARFAARPLHAARRGDGALQSWQTEQQGDALRFGAWLGVRHTSTDDVAKVYAELPAGLGREHLQRHRCLNMRGLSWRMAGLLADGRSEFYARAAMIDVAALRELEITAFGTTGGLTRLAVALTADDRLPRPAGISVTLDPTDGVQALTWFTFAKSVFRDDQAAAEGILTAAATPPSTLAAGAGELYRALCDGRPDGRWRHAMIGAGIAADGSAWVQAGLRPS